MNPLVSIIIPNYNHELYLKQRLNSVFNQTYTNFEVILLDDCSTDNSVTILNEYKDHSKVSHFIVNTKNSGSPFKQWQKGIALAKGKYVWIAESDDYCELNFLEALIGLINKRPNIGLVYCSSMNVDTDNDQLGENNWAKITNYKKWSSNYSNTGINEIKYHLRFRNTIPNASAVIFNLEIAKAIKIPSTMFYCGDWFLWISILQKSDIAYGSQALNYFRRHKNSTRTIKSIKNEYERFKEYSFVIKKNSSLISRNINYKKYYWLVEEWLQKSNYFSFMQALQIKLPMPLYLIFFRSYIMRKIKKKLRWMQFVQ
ncbi:glycosyltransferase family 2 protein [Lutibacter sp. HS1-25]|uniref:glycosyltransferase family 2 protein n=1 Tax=Lutibacter sp. HS1-25 TaxID=2485000 RepID=UPI001010ABA7|nr:glycosyltransferase family 2 protein [Lutibacter sp. HS1-25]RXP52919.1 glycosyltransferase family 2 protein [Lutibacter sp. HS1-25]